MADPVLMNPSIPYASKNMDVAHRGSNPIDRHTVRWCIEWTGSHVRPCSNWSALAPTLDKKTMPNGPDRQ